MAILEIGTTEYDVGVLKLDEISEFLDSEQTHRTQDGDLYRKLIGIYFNYELDVSGFANRQAAQNLWDKIHEFVPFHNVTLPHDDGTQTFKAYVTGVKRTLVQQKNGVNYWDDYTVKFIAKKPAIS